MPVYTIPPRISSGSTPPPVTPPTSVVDSDMTGVVGIIYDITGLTAPRTFTLPDATSIGDTITITNTDGSFDAFDLTVDVIHAGTVNEKSSIVVNRGFAEIEFKAISTGAGSQWSALGDITVGDVTIPDKGSTATEIGFIGSLTDTLITNGASRTNICLMILHNTNTVVETFSLYKVPPAGSPTNANKFLSMPLEPNETIVLGTDMLPTLENSGDMLSIIVSTINIFTVQVYVNGESVETFDTLLDMTAYAAGTHDILSGGAKNWLKGSITNVAAVDNTITLNKTVPAGAPSSSNQFLNLVLTPNETLFLDFDDPGIKIGATDSIKMTCTQSTTMQMYGTI